LGLAVLSLGIAFSVRANLGTTPISSLPYVVSLLTSLTIGNATIVLHCVFILAQIAIRRRSFDLKQLIGLPAAFALGYFTDGAMLLTKNLVVETYLGQWTLCAVGIALAGIGAALDVAADVVMLPSDGLVVTVSKISLFKFGYLKVIFDASLVITSCVLSLAFIGEFKGVREGTAAAALLVGIIARMCAKLLKRKE
jgi:uncharacterized membrane protein YczE